MTSLKRADWAYTQRQIQKFGWWKVNWVYFQFRCLSWFTMGRGLYIEAVDHYCGKILDSIDS